MPEATPTAADEEAAWKVVKDLRSALLNSAVLRQQPIGVVERLETNWTAIVAAALARVREDAAQAASKAVSETDLTWRVAEVLAITQSNECEPDMTDSQYDGGEWRIEADQCLEQAVAVISAMRSFMLAEQREARAAYGTLCAAASRKEALEQAAAVAKAHIGSAEKERRQKFGRQQKSWSSEAWSEIDAEERGETVASEMIERAIRALTLPLNKKPKEEAHDD